MKLKEIILHGATISLPYKEKESEWVGESEISCFAGYFSTPKIVVKINGANSYFDLEKIDDAVRFFEESVFNPKNLCFMLNQVVCELNKNSDYVDLEIENDKKRVREDVTNQKLIK